MSDTKADPLRKAIEAYSELNEGFKELKVKPVVFKVAAKCKV